MDLNRFFLCSSHHVAIDIEQCNECGDWLCDSCSPGIEKCDRCGWSDCGKHGSGASGCRLCGGPTIEIGKLDDRAKGGSFLFALGTKLHYREMLGNEILIARSKRDTRTFRRRSGDRTWVQTK